MHIAFIDDKATNLLAWRTRMEDICRGQAQLTTYQSVEAFEEALEEGYQPHIVFTDFNIDDRFGTEIVVMLRQLFGRRVYIIAHSSNEERNEYLLRIGANEIIPKHQKTYPPPTLEESFWSFDDLVERWEAQLEEE